MKQRLIPDMETQSLGFIITFLTSGTLVVLLLGPNLLGPRLGPVATSVIYLAPWFCMWAVSGHHPITDPGHRVEVLLIMAILSLGALNIVFSQDPGKSFRSVVIFLSTGVLVFWTAMILFKDSRTVKFLDLFCCFSFAVVVFTEIAVHYANPSAAWNKVGFLVGNPIPTTGLLIALLSGPLSLLASRSKGIKAIGLVLLLSGLILTVLTEKRSALLAIVVMFAVWVAYKRSRLGYAVIALMVVSALVFPMRSMSLLKPLDPSISSHFTVLYRLEQYPFALHILEKHAFTGIGLRSFSHTKFLEDYQRKNPRLICFEAEVKQIQTFDNMVLTSLVELGSIFTVAYLSLLAYVAVTYFRSCGTNGTDNRYRIYSVFPLIGLSVQSMAYDSLMFPSINWLFHAHLGILAAVSRRERHSGRNSIAVVN
jgi:hypothetical protein